MTALNSTKYHPSKHAENFSIVINEGREPLQLEVNFYRDIIKTIHDVHVSGAKKWKAFSAENNPTVLGDSTTVCNLDAMMRHLLLLCMGEDCEHESGMPHANHVLCRMSMLISSWYTEQLIKDTKFTPKEELTLTSPELESILHSNSMLLTPPVTIWVLLNTVLSDDNETLFQDSLNDVILKYLYNKNDGTLKNVRTIDRIFYGELVRMYPGLVETINVNSTKKITDGKITLGMLNLESTSLPNLVGHILFELEDVCNLIMNTIGWYITRTHVSRNTARQVETLATVSDEKKNVSPKHLRKSSTI